MIIVDTSAWVHHLRYTNPIVDNLITKQLAATTDVILLELVPFLKLQVSQKHISYFKEIDRISTIFFSKQWDLLIQYQEELIHQGVNGIGIPDLIIMVVAKINKTPIFSLDKQFEKASKILDFQIYQP